MDESDWVLVFKSSEDTGENTPATASYDISSNNIAIFDDCRVTALGTYENIPWILYSAEYDEDGRLLNLTGQEVSDLSEIETVHTATKRTFLWKGMRPYRSN